MKVTKGQSVIVPKGRKGTVRAVGKIMTGKRGRPAHVATVQLRGRDGKLTPGTKEYRVRELTPA